MGMPRITNGGPERVRKLSLGEREGRSSKLRKKKKGPLSIDATILKPTHKAYKSISVNAPLRKQDRSGPPKYCVWTLLKAYGFGVKLVASLYMPARSLGLVIRERQHKGNGLIKRDDGGNFAPN